MHRKDLFPDIEPYAQGFFAVEAPHELYWEESGNPQGIPVLFLHGGPGAGAMPAHRRFFDPHRYRIVIFDQRGAGRSRPSGELSGNTTGNLVKDIETLRRLRGIEKWLLFGGSWGSSLALAYAQAHPDRCLGLILRGIFLCRRDEVTWFLEGMRRVFPEAWNEFTRFLPEPERGDLLGNYYRRLTDPDPDVHLPAGAAWSRYESACSTLLPNPEATGPVGDLTKALGLARIEAHYFVNDCFLDEGALLANVSRLKDVPGVIVQGRYDMVCPIASAAALAEAWPTASYIVVPDAGHSAMEPGIRAALVQATERFKAGPAR
jgi:proline iminopeptidase